MRASQCFFIVRFQYNDFAVDAFAIKTEFECKARFLCHGDL